jgi:uncharacterized membrane protein YgcG
MGMGQNLLSTHRVLAKLFFLICFFTLYNFSIPTLAAPLPEAPTYYVYDETNTLDEFALNALQTLLVEHDRLTNEQFMIAVLEKPEKEAFANLKSQIFEKWRIGKRESKNNGILLMAANQLKKAEFEVGLSLDPVFPLEKRAEILDSYVIPNLKRKKLLAALALGVYHTLDTLNSPLILSGEAAKILKTLGLEPNQSITPESFSWTGALFLFFLGIIAVGVILYEILAREAHFTSTGWFRVRPFQGYLPWLQDMLPKKKKATSDKDIRGGITGGW